MSKDLLTEIMRLEGELARISRELDALKRAAGVPSSKRTQSFPRMQRAVLDQCFRVLHAFRPEPAIAARLEAFICGNPTPPPGMEQYLEQYAAILIGELPIQLRRGQDPA